MEEYVTPPQSRWNDGDEERPIIRGDFAVTPKPWFEQASYWVWFGLGLLTGAGLVLWWWR